MSSKIATLLFLTFIGASIVFGMSFFSKEQQTLSVQPSPTNKPSEKITVIAKNLQVPWALAFLPASPRGEPDGGRIKFGPDNMLYITTSNKDGRGSPAFDDDRILRINPDVL